MDWDDGGAEAMREPALAVVRGHYAWKSASIVTAADHAEGLAQFDRWLAAHDAEVRAAAYKHAAQIAESERDQYESMDHNTATILIAAAIRAAAPADIDKES